jgi:hypothetical protein
MINKDIWVNQLKLEIASLQNLQKVLAFKNPTDPFLLPVIENATYTMVNALLYLEGNNKYLSSFDERYFHDRQVDMHRSFISSLHISIEEGLKIIISRENISPPKISSKERMISIVRRIENKCSNCPDLASETIDLVKVGMPYPSFMDHLVAVLENLPKLDDQTKQAVITYFNGLSDLRNNVSHPSRSFTQSEIEGLKKAELGSTISKDGTMQMTFEHYKLFIYDAVRFFDIVNASL